MSRQLTTSRTSRNRRLVAMSVWLGLILTAMVLWNSRSQNADISYPSEPVAFLLAAFTTFVSLFAWMLYNPARGVSAETTTLMLAGAATLFPPGIIAYCVMPPESALGGWLTAGLFLLLVIAVMSPVPEEFFGIPRDRHSYFQQVSIIGISDKSVLELHPDWLQSTDLTAAVPDREHPSLAPSSWLDEERPATRSERRRRTTPRRAKEKPSAETAPAEERKGLLRRLKERASSLRDSSSRGESTESTSAPVTQQKRPSRGESAEQRPVERSRPQSPAVPVPLPESKPVDQPESSTEAPPRIPLAELRPSAPETDSRPTTESPAGFFDPFADNAQTEEEASAASPPSSDSELQIADHSQQTEFERVADELGGEMIEGTVMIRFSRGQKRANVHVPFSPPLAGRPEVECSAVEDDSIRVKVPECRSWGIRIEGRRSDTSTEQESEIAFSAVYVASR